MKTFSLPLLSLVLLLSACAPNAKIKPKPRTDAPITLSGPIGDYKEYEQGVIGNGESAVLFFYASWCPNCIEKDESLHEWYANAAFPMKTYKINFDTEVALKTKYGITMQDTFVLIDGEGEPIRTEVAPSLSVLKRLLYANITPAKADTVSSSSTAKEPATEQRGAYSMYADGVIGNGQFSVLFFHAAWCPNCIANDKLLTAWYASEQFSRSVYRIDFDTAAALKQQFGVVQQDTFILIDADGNVVSQVSFPSENALRELLG